MNRGIIIATLFIVSLSLAISSNAQEEFTSGSLIFPDNAYSTPHDPKVACHPNGDHCLLAFYDSLDGKIKFKFSWNKGHHFEGLLFGCTGLDLLLGCSEVATATNSLDMDRLPTIGSYHLPFDVTWVNDDNRYYAFIENVDYQYIPSGAFSTLRTNGGQYWGIQFVNDTTYFQLNTYHDGTGKNRWYLKDITDGSTEDSGLTGSTGGCSGSGGVNYNIENAYGFSAINDGTLFYRIWYGYNSQNCSSQTQGTLPEASGVTGISYYVNGIMQYHLNRNETKEAYTSDFSSYTSASTVYSWPYGQYINNSMSNKIDTNQVYAYELNNETGSISGIYIYNIGLYPLQVSLNVQDPDRGDTIANTSVSIICQASNYTQTDTSTTDNPAELSTPCLTGNMLSIQTTEGQPLTFNFSYSVLSGCEALKTYVYTPPSSGYVGYYNLTIRVRDSIRNQGVPGALITLSGDTQTTNAQGNAYFQVSPIANAYFTTETNAGSCLYKLYVGGDERQYNILGTATGYDPYIEGNIILGKDPFSLEGGDFTTTKTIIMDQQGATAEVHVYSSDGIELTPGSIQIKAEGSNNTYVNSYGEFIESNISYVVPATFRFIDTRASWPVNFTLYYKYGASCSSQDVYQQNATMTQNGFHTVDFYINENFANLKCCYDTDCPESVCSGKYYKEFSSCSSGLCTYTTDQCDSSDRCDPERGCFDIQYTQECDIDAECVDTCLTNYSMVDKSCGYDGLCIGQEIACSTNCSSTEGVCSELLACIYPEKEKFVLIFPNVVENSYDQVLKKEITCNFDNAGSSFCISNKYELLDSVGLLWSTPLLDQVSATPEDWKYIRNTADNGYIFYAISGSCSDTCGLTYEYCEKGCSVDTGKCIGATTGEQNAYSDWFDGFFAWLYSIIPVEYRVMAWLFFTIFVMLQYRHRIKGHSGGDKDTLLVGFVMFLAGVSIGWIHWIFLLITGIIIAFVLYERGGFNR